LKNPEEDAVDGVGYFLALAQQVFFVMEYFSPITLLLAAAWVWAFAATKPAPKGGRWRLFALGCLPPLAFPVAILVVGVVFVSKPPWVTRIEAPAYPGYLLLGLLLVQLPLAAGAVRWWGGQRPAVAVSWLCGGYVSLAAAFISGMSVTGEWL
jgi:hypothetical protein